MVVAVEVFVMVVQDGKVEVGVMVVVTAGHTVQVVAVDMLTLGLQGMVAGVVVVLIGNGGIEMVVILIGNGGIEYLCCMIVRRFLFHLDINKLKLAYILVLFDSLVLSSLGHPCVSEMMYGEFKNSNINYVLTISSTTCAFYCCKLTAILTHL